MIKFLRPRSENMREVVMVLCDALNRIENYVREQETQKAADAVKVSAILADITSLRGDVESLSADFEKLTGNVAELKERVEIIEGDIEYIKSRI